MTVHAPVRLTLARSFADGGMHYRVLAQRLDEDPASSNSSGHEIATVELNRSITLETGEVFGIERRGSLLSRAPVLVASERSAAQVSIVATVRRERVGFWWQRVLVSKSSAEKRFLLHRRGAFGSPANTDVLASVPTSTTVDLAKIPVVLRVEKAGAWRLRLQAQWLDPARLSLPLVLFVMNELADEDRRAAIAASAGVAGV